MSLVSGHCDSFIIIKINALEPFSHGGTVTDPTVSDPTVLRADMKTFPAISKWTRGQHAGPSLQRQPNTKLGKFFFVPPQSHQRCEMNLPSCKMSDDINPHRDTPSAAQR